MIYYAVLNSDYICESVDERSQTLVQLPINYIEINSHDDVQWRKYENGQWSEEKFLPPEPTQEASLEDKINYIYYKQMGVI